MSASCSISPREHDVHYEKISLADTMAWGTPHAVKRMIGAVRERYPDAPLSLHLHDTRGMGIANACAGLEMGITMFDAAVAGLGGCPFAAHKGAAGNVCTEDLVFLCEEMGIDTGIDLDALIECAQLAEEIVGHPLPGCGETRRQPGAAACRHARRGARMSLPLAGTRVLDLTNVIAGPLASYLLALMGAEVIKVEVPGIGDLSRKMGADPAMGRQQMGASYLAFNAGKKSITLNLKTRARQGFVPQAVRWMPMWCWRTSGPARCSGWASAPKTLRALNPRLIYCAVSGFGQTGPLAERASYDQIIQGYCGLMALTGEPDTAPVKAGLVVCDTTAAITAAFAIAAASGASATPPAKARSIDVSMLDCALASMTSWVISNYLNAGYAAQPIGNHSQTSAPSGTFRTGDGPLNIVNNEQKQFQATCDALGLAGTEDRSRASPNATIGCANQAELRAILEANLADAIAPPTWEQRLAAAGVPVGPVLSVRADRRASANARARPVADGARAGAGSRCAGRGAGFPTWRQAGADRVAAAGVGRAYRRRCSATWAAPTARSPRCAHEGVM